MNDQLQIRGEWRNDIPLLEIDYLPAQMFQPGTAETLSERLISQYRTLLKKSPPESRSGACVLFIKATTAGSPLVRAIFEVYKAIHADSGTLFCANYPVNYIESLTSLGLTALPGFKLTTTLDEALKLAQTRG
jgi:hypothetical protein